MLPGLEPVLMYGTLSSFSNFTNKRRKNKVRTAAESRDMTEKVVEAEVKNKEEAANSLEDPGMKNG